MQTLNIRPVTDLRNKFNEIESDIKAGPVFFTKNGYGASVMLSIEAYQAIVDPMEAILSETDRLAANDARRFSADRLIDAAFDAIYERLHAPEAFEPYPSKLDREHPYYRIPVGNFLVLYVVIGRTMEVRRFIYARRNWQAWPL